MTHVLVALWSAEILHSLRLRAQTFSALCPDPPAAFEAWWDGTPPAQGMATTLVLFDPAALGTRRRVFVGLDRLRIAEPRYRNYADAAARLREALRT